MMDRAYLKQIALHATPAALLKLLLLCTNARIPFSYEDRSVISSSVYTAAFEQHRNAGLSQYLIEGRIPPKASLGTPCRASTSIGEDQHARNTINDHAVVEMLLLRLQGLKEAWILLTKERASNVNAEVIQTMVSLIIVGCVLPKLLGIEQNQTCKEVIHIAHQSWALVSGFLEPSRDVDFSNSTVAAATATAIRSSEVVRADDPILQGVSFMLPSLLIRLRNRIDPAEEREGDDMDLVDAEESFLSHSSQVETDKHISFENRQDLPFATNQRHFRRELILQLQMYLSVAEAARPSEERGLASILDYLDHLRPEDLLASRRSVSIFLRSFKLSRSEACQLLRSVAQACIQDYTFERCEASLCLCLEVMTALAEKWGTGEGDELHEVASDVYEWFIQVPLGKGLASTRVFISLAKFLHTVLNLRPPYNIPSLPSSRTSLFDILRRGSNVVKFHVAEMVSSIFSRFILTEHTAILEDVIESLPNDAADLDGISLRLYVLAELSARWATLLRQCVYYMLQTPAHIPASVRHAKSCLQKTSSTLSLESPRELFILFAPQFLYTWLETETMESIPFAIYGFESLQELITVVRDEVVGQIVMRANRNLGNRLSEIVQSPFDAILEASFPKAEAYSVARDISMPPSNDSSSKSTESQLRKQLGTDRYLRLVSVSFPQIVANLFMSLGDEHEIGRAFAKRSELAYAATNLQSICHLSASKVMLPPGQQPSFRAKYLIDELEFLCQRIGKDLSTMWTSQLIVFVVRNLLDSIVPALGSLHACSVLRKIRVLVALAGQKALQGYALEMLLQALQPYLVQFYSAEDALGLFWYLLDQGRKYLERKLSFLSGIALTTLLSLSAFLAVPQDSTTQESHYLSTLSNSESFHTWFGEYLTKFPTHSLTADRATAFKVMIAYAQDVRPPGRAEKDTAEGHLLLELFEDRTSERELLSPTAFKKAVQILCAKFLRPGKPEEDILGEDSLAIRHARILWRLMRDLDVSQEFWTWSGEALGRAYAACGIIDATLTGEHPDDLFRPHDTDDTSAPTSRSIVLQRVRDLLHSDDSAAASLAEKTLRQVTTEVAQHRTLDDYESSLGLDLIQALNWHPSPCPDVSDFKHHNLACRDQVALDPQLSVTTWASQFLVSLTASIKGDPLLGALLPILSRLPALAFRILPYTVHEFLRADTGDRQPRCQTVSQPFRDVLLDRRPWISGHQRLVIRTLLYLRCQPVRKEMTIADRLTWLDIDFAMAARAATSCAMHKSALLLLELHISQQTGHTGRSSRRSSTTRARESPDLLRQIYQSLDDPDFFYGMQEEASLSSVMRQLDHEGNDFKKLSFQSAMFDSVIKAPDTNDQSGLLEALVSANMNGVARAVQAHLPLDVGQPANSGISASLTALNLHQWDLPVSSTISDPPSLLFQVFRAANTSLNFMEVSTRLDQALLSLVKNIAQERPIGNTLRQSMSALAALTETKAVLSSRSADSLSTHLLALVKREEWQETEK